MFMSIAVLKDELKKNIIRNLYLFYGPEEYLKKTYLESLEEKLLDKKFRTVNRIVLEGKADPNRIIDACETLPMFSGKKLVVVKDSNLFKAKKKAGQPGETADSKKDTLQEYLKDVPSHTCLVFYEAEIDGRLKIADTVKKFGLAVEFGLQKPQDLVIWVARTFKSLGKDIDQQAASYIVDASDLDMSGIMNEIDKINSYAGERSKIVLTDVASVCTRSLKSRIFDLTDAIADKNGLPALKILNDLITMKEPVPKILYMIARQFRQIIEMKYLKAKGASSSEAASRLGITPYAVGKISKQADKFDEASLKKALLTCLELDEAIKSGRMEDRAAAEILIAYFSK